MTTECKTLSVPAAGKLYFDLSRNASYEAVKRGQIPVVRIGRKYRVPVAAMERLLDSAASNPASWAPAGNEVQAKPHDTHLGRVC